MIQNEHAVCVIANQAWDSLFGPGIKQVIFSLGISSPKSQVTFPPEDTAVLQAVSRLFKEKRIVVWQIEFVFWLLISIKINVIKQKWADYSLFIS